MREIKLSGREMALLRCVDFATGTRGQEIIERLSMPAADVLDLVAGLAEVGYVEIPPDGKLPALAEFPDALVDVNPGYAQLLKEAMRRRG